MILTYGANRVNRYKRVRAWDGGMTFIALHGVCSVCSCVPCDRSRYEQKKKKKSNTRMRMQVESYVDDSIMHIIMLYFLYICV